MSDRPWWRRLVTREGPHVGVEVTVWVMLAVAAVFPALGSPDRLAGDGVDLYGTIWFFWWIRHTVETGIDPGFTDLFFYPYGKDIFAHTGNNFVDAYLSIPLQWLLGTPRYYKWWVVVVLVGNAASFRLLARSFLRTRWAVAVATVAFLINPYVMFELTCGRPTQAMLWFLVLALWSLTRVGRGWGWTVLCGVAVALTGYSYWFYAFFFAFAAVWLVGVEAVSLGRASGRRAALGYLAHVGGAALIAVLLVLPAVIGMASRADAGVIPGVDPSEARSLFSLPGDIANGVASTLHGYLLTEPTGARFFQHPAWAAGTLAWLILGGGRLRWAGVLVVGLLLATGPVQHLFGGDAVMYHYVLLYNGLPFFDRLWFPYRALALCFVASSLGIGFAVQRIGELSRVRWVPAGVVALLLGSTLLSENQDATFPLVVRDVPLPSAYPWMAAQGGGIIDLPRGITQTAIVHQTRHGLPLFGGMGENASIFWPPGHRDRLKNRFVRSLTRAARHPFREIDPAEPDPRLVLSQGFRWVVLHRELIDSEFNRYAEELTPQQREQAPFEAVRRLTELLGPPVLAEGPMVVWALSPVEIDPPPDLRPNDTTLWTRVWQRPEPLPYEARLYELGRL